MSTNRKHTDRPGPRGDPTRGESPKKCVKGSTKWSKHVLQWFSFVLASTYKLNIFIRSWMIWEQKLSDKYRKISPSTLIDFFLQKKGLMSFIIECMAVWVQVGLLNLYSSREQGDSSKSPIFCIGFPFRVKFDPTINL